MDIESDSIENTGWVDINVDASTGGGFTGKNGEKISLFMRLEIRAEPYRVRLVSPVLNFRKHWDAFKVLKQYPISPAYKKEEKDLDVAWSQGRWCPRKRHVTIAIDREHPKMLRILEAGPQVFQAFGNFGTMTKKNPAGPSGPDWLIKAEKVEGQTRYSVMPDPSGPKPFTAEEIELIHNSKVSLKWVEEKFYSKASPEYIKELWEQLPEDKKYSKKDDDEDAEEQGRPQVPQTQAPAAPPPATPPPVAQAPVKDDGFLKDKPAAPAAPAAKEAAPAPVPAPVPAPKPEMKPVEESESVSLF